MAGETQATAIPIELPYSGSGTAASNQVIWYKFTATEGYTATISTAGSSYDTILVLFNSSGDVVTSNDDFDGVTSKIVQGPLAAGDYYVAQLGYNGQSWSSGFNVTGGSYAGNFVMNVSEAAPAPPPPPPEPFYIRWFDPVTGEPGGPNANGAATIVMENPTAVDAVYGSSYEYGPFMYMGVVGGTNSTVSWSVSWAPADPAGEIENPTPPRDPSNTAFSDGKAYTTFLTPLRWGGGYGTGTFTATIDGSPAENTLTATATRVAPAPPPPPSPPTVQLWHFDESSGSELTREEATGYNQFVDPVGGAISIKNPGTARFGTNALALEGSGDYTFPSVDVISDNWTLEFSTNWPVHSRNSAVAVLSLNRFGSNEFTISAAPVEIVVAGPDGNELVGDPNQYSMSIGSFSAAVPAGEWIDWAVVFDGSSDTLSVYQNGARVYNGAAPEFDWANGWNWGSFIVGRGGWNYNYNDPFYIDELRISNAALYTGTSHEERTEPFSLGPPPEFTSSSTVVLLRAASMHQHVQATPSATWTIVHHMNYNQGTPVYPVVDAYTMVEGALTKVLPDTVTYVDDSTITLNFGSSYSGFATAV